LSVGLWQISEAFACLSKRTILQEYLPAGRQVGKRNRSSTMPSFSPSHKSKSSSWNEVQERFAPHFVAVLREMERLQP